MGTHAFDDAPGHCAIYRDIAPASLPTLHGLSARWNMPAARHRQSLPGSYFPGVDHYVLTIHLGGASVRRVDRPSFPHVARTGALSLQAPFSGGAFLSAGPVEYGHLYFAQSLLCEVGDEIGLGDDAKVQDFFGRADPDCAREVRAYVGRAVDAADPASPIEMDSRAYLIGLALLRASRGRGAIAAVERPPVRHDIARALQLIEERIDQPLRLSDLAAAVGLSPFHFARLFRDAVGETPAAYLMRRRTERAVDLIRTTRLPLGEIAFRTGFSSQAHMTRRVKALAGLTPRRLRD